MRKVYQVVGFELVTMCVVPFGTAALGFAAGFLCGPSVIGALAAGALLAIVPSLVFTIIRNESRPR